MLLLCFFFYSRLIRWSVLAFSSHSVVSPRRLLLLCLCCCYYRHHFVEVVIITIRSYKYSLNGVVFCKLVLTNLRVYSFLYLEFLHGIHPVAWYKICRGILYYLNSLQPLHYWRYILLHYWRFPTALYPSKATNFCMSSVQRICGIPLLTYHSARIYLCIILFRLSSGPLSLCPALLHLNFAILLVMSVYLHSVTVFGHYAVHCPYRASLCFSHHKSPCFHTICQGW